MDAETAASAHNDGVSIELGARFRLVSGNPTYAPVGSVHDLDTNRYSSLASGVQSRLATFHQLDLRFRGEDR